MNVREFGLKVQRIQPELPVIISRSIREAQPARGDGRSGGYRAHFVWSGDTRIFLAIVKYVEDRQNAWPTPRPLESNP